MSDFLTRLAERTLGLAPTVQPLIATMFAPGPLLGGDYPPGVSGDDDLPHPADMQFALTKPGSILPPLVPQGRGLSATGERYTHRTPDHRSVSSPDVASPPSEQDDAPSAPARTGGDDRLVLPLASRPVNIERPILGERSTEGTAGPAIPLSIRGSSEFHADSARSSPVQRDAPGAELATTSTPESGKRRIIPVVSPYHERRPPAGQAAHEAATPESLPQPTIRVTIGRVEVRAIMPSSPPTPHRESVRSGPALSLDDYLKQRDRGER